MLNTFIRLQTIKNHFSITFFTNNFMKNTFTKSFNYKITSLLIYAILPFFLISKSYSIEKSQNETKQYGNRFYIRFAPNSKYLNEANSEMEIKSKNNSTLGISPSGEKKLFNIIRPIFPEKARLKNNQARLNMLKFKKGFNQEQIDKIYKLEEVLERTFVAEKIDYNPENDLLTFCKKLKLYINEIEDAEPIYEYQLQSQYIPNDPFAQQQEMLKSIKAFEAFAVNFGDPEVTIAISDNGVDNTHADLQPNIKLNTSDPVNGIDDDGNGYIDDYDGFDIYSLETNKNYNITKVSDSHGTNVAGIAAAKTDNSTGIVGVGGLCTMFPIKASSNNPDAVALGYESILFAGVRAFDVINCSWGNEKKGFSSIEQSIIDFADANGVFVIASAGNRNFTEIDEEKLATFYPAAYNNVFAVGEVDMYDYITNYTGLGSHVDIMAPGYENYTTFNSGGYSRAGYGTSFASPVVAGAVGIIKSNNPNLSHKQIASIIKQTGDDITPLNQDAARFLPNRLNLFNAVSIDPYSIPGIELEKVNYKNNTGKSQQRFFGYDTVNIEFELKNYLGDGKNLRFEMYPIFINSEFAITLVNNKVDLPSIKTDETINLSGFKFIQNDFSGQKIVFRVDIIGENDYFDFFFFDYIPNNPIHTFENNKLLLSVSDEGILGYTNSENNKQGKGFKVDGVGEGLYIGGLLTTINGANLSSAYNNGNSNFVAIKSFSNPDTAATISNKLTLTIFQDVLLNKKDDKFIRFNLDVENNAGEPMKDMAIGYYADWDLGLGTEAFSNNIALLNNVIPNDYNGIGAVQYASNKKGNIHFGALVASEEPDSEPQIAYVPNSASSNMIKGLNNGILWKTDSTNDDISGVFGIKFNGILENNKRKKCVVCLAGGSTKDELVLNLQNCLMNKTVSIKDNNGQNIELSNIKIVPNPIENQFSIMGLETLIKANQITNISIFDLFGNTIINYDNSSILANNFIIDSQTSNKLNTGSYYIKIDTKDNQSIIKHIIKR